MTRLERLFKAIDSDCDLEPLFEAILREEHLREMFSLTSLRLANTFIGILKSWGISEKEWISDEKLEKASNQTIDRFGAGIKEGLNFKFLEEEQKAKNPRKVYIQNFAVFVANGIGFLAKPFQVFIERLKTIFNSALNNRRIFSIIDTPISRV